MRASEVFLVKNKLRYNQTLIHYDQKQFKYAWLHLFLCLYEEVNNINPLRCNAPYFTH